MTTMLPGHNEKMLPTSYSIAVWPHWLCITSDTVCCITSTCELYTALGAAANGENGR